MHHKEKKQFTQQEVNKGSLNCEAEVEIYVKCKLHKYDFFVCDSVM